MMNEQNQSSPEIVETEVGTFEILKNYKEAYDSKSFIERYVDHFDRYQYIVGDISAEMLRLKGFGKQDYHKIYDYLMESAVPNAPYFILRRIKTETPQETKENDKDHSDNETQSTEDE